MHESNSPKSDEVGQLSEGVGQVCSPSVTLSFPNHRIRTPGSCRRRTLPDPLDNLEILHCYAS